MSRQCRLILDRLRQGPATNTELASIALKYTSRISDLRAAGIDVSMIDHNHASGITRYALTQETTSHVLP